MLHNLADILNIITSEHKSSMKASESRDMEVVLGEKQRLLKQVLLLEGTLINLCVSGFFTNAASFSHVQQTSAVGGFS